MATACDNKDSASAFRPADRKRRHMLRMGNPYISFLRENIWKTRVHLLKNVDGTRSSAAVCLYDVGKPSIKG